MVWQIIQDFGSSVTLDPTPMHILYGHDDGITSVDVSIELDMVASASIDGTINIHTLKKGYFVKTISFLNENISRFLSLNVRISNQRNILVYTHAIAKNQTNTYLSPQYKVFNLFSKIEFYFKQFFSGLSKEYL